MLTEQLNDTPNEIQSATGPMNETMRQYVADSKRKREIEAELKAIETRMKGVEEPLLNYMAESGMQRVSIDGMTLYIHTDVWPRFRVDENGNPYSKADVMDAMRKCGLSDYISETYNSNSFAAYVREMRDNGGLPPELDAVVEISEKYSVRTRAGR